MSCEWLGCGVQEKESDLFLILDFFLVYISELQVNRWYLSP